uniref:Uncharacterized protein n=1 Tax=Oryza rufipogon TaxID=4529 RepID=A0A0E0N8I5_ORYRU
MSLSSYLTCNLVTRQRQRGGVEEDEYDGRRQPQTATCCTALKRGVTADGLLAQPRYAPVRTPQSALLLLDPPPPAPMTPTSSSSNSNHDDDDEKKKKKQPMLQQQKQVRKCKSTVEEASASQLMECKGGGPPPRLRRSGGVRRDWSFEDLRANNTAA